MGEKVKEFISHLWKVYPPEFEKPGQSSGPIVDDKPVAKLPDAEEVAQDVDADIKNDDDAKQVGVAIAQATYALTGKTWYFMMVALFVVYYVYSMDNLSTGTYLSFIMFSVRNDAAPSYITASAVQNVTAGVAKLVIGKLADIYGRFFASCVTLFFYVLGFLISAVAQNNATQTAGVALLAVGNSGLLIVIWIILADFLSSRMRAFGIAFVTMPFFITFATAPKITSAVTGLPTDPDSHWRWGFGMFCILIPATMAPIMAILYYLERKAKKSGLVPVHPYLRYGFWYGFKQFLLDADIIGMILILAGFLFMLLALTRGGDVGWSTDWIIALLTVGGVLILLVPVYEYYFSPRPFIRRRWLNSSVVLAILIAFFDFASFNISSQMLFYWRSIGLNLSPGDDKTNYFTYTDSLSLTIFGVIAGMIIFYTRRYKYLTVCGAAIRMIAYGLMIRYRHVGTSMVQAVWPQILLGMGGGMVGDVITISSQVTVRHQDVAMVTAVVMMFQSIGSSIGIATYSSIVNDQFPKKLMEYRGIDAAQAQQESAELLASYGMGPDRDTPKVQEQIRAWNDAAARGLWAGIVFSGVVFLLSLFLKDYVLTRSQNVVSDELPEKSPLAMSKDDTYERAIERAEEREAQGDGVPVSQSDKTLPTYESSNGAAPPITGEYTAKDQYPMQTMGNNNM